MDVLILIHFCFKVNDIRPCKISLSSCTSLKMLTLGHIQHEFIGKLECFPHLETLDLSRVKGLKNVVISNPKLKRLSLDECKEMIDVSINAPNLQSLIFRGPNMPHIELHPCSLRHAKLCFEPITHSGSIKFQKQRYIPKVMKFLSTLDCEGGFKFFVQSQKVFFF